jgi:hypothetical protein
LLISTEPPVLDRDESSCDPNVKPEYLDVAGIPVNLIPVRAKPMPTASKLGRAKPAVSHANDLADPDR